MANTNLYYILHRVLALAGLVIFSATLSLSFYLHTQFRGPYESYGFSGLPGYFFLAMAGIFFALNRAWHETRYKREWFGFFVVIAALATITCAYKIVNISQRDAGNDLISYWLQYITQALFAPKIFPATWLLQANDICSIVLPVAMIACFLALLLVRSKTPEATVTAEPESGVGKRPAGLHKAFSVAGILCIMVFAGAGYISENRYDPGLNLHIFSNGLLYTVLGIFLLYFILNLVWHRSPLKQELFGAFSLFAMAGAVALLVALYETFSGLFETRNKSDRFPGLFHTDNPPPNWLEGLIQAGMIGLLAAMVVCFILLWRLRRKQNA